MTVPYADWPEHHATRLQKQEGGIVTACLYFNIVVLLQHCLLGIQHIMGIR